MAVLVNVSKCAYLEQNAKLERINRRPPGHNVLGSIRGGVRQHSALNYRPSAPEVIILLTLA